MKYCTLYYSNITYGHIHYDALCLHSGYVQYVVVDKGIKQQYTCLRLRAYINAKGGTFSTTVKTS